MRVSESQAVERAVETFGGEPSEWRAQLKYTSMAYDRAPAYFQPMISRQVMRLMYVVSSERGAVMVDSVTGSVLDSWTADAAKGSVRNSDASARNKEGDTGRQREKAGSGVAASKLGPPSSLLTLAIGAGIAFVAAGGVVLFRRARVRR